MNFKSSNAVQKANPHEPIEHQDSEPCLHVSIRQDATGVIVEARGDLDLLTVSTLDDQLEDSIDLLKNLEPSKVLVLDLSQLEFIDSAGLALLIRISRELGTIDRVLRVVVTRGRQPDRVLKIGQFYRILDLAYEIRG